jgi:hypothetical protein
MASAPHSVVIQQDFIKNTKSAVINKVLQKSTKLASSGCKSEEYTARNGIITKMINEEP